MFSTAVLDVAVGLIFAFLAASLGVGAIVEAISSVLKWRARTLLAGIKALVNDTAFNGLAKELYEHASVNPRADGSGTHSIGRTKPAYVDPKQFANAFLDVTNLTDELTRAGATATSVITAFDKKVQDQQLRWSAPHSSAQVGSLG